MSKGHKVADFAKLIGISQGSLSDIENGKTKPSAETLASIVRNTDINAAWLLTDIGDMEARGRRGIHQVANGNGHIMVGGAMSGQIVGGGVNTKQSDVNFSVKEPRADCCPIPPTSSKKDLEEIYALLCEYGSPKFLQELKAKLIQIKKVMDGD